MEITEFAKQLNLLFREVLFEFKRSSDDDRQYWQGRKDGMRAIMALLPEIGVDVGIDAGIQNETSPGYRMTENEIVRSLLEEFVYHGAAIIYEIQELPRVDIRTKIGLRNAIRWYDMLAQDGELPPITDHCLHDD